jgi:hypothetical protein
VKETVKERNQRLQKIESSPMLIDWSNQKSETGYITKSILHVQFTSHQNSNDLEHRDLKIIPKVHLEARNTVNGQDNSEQKEQYWKYQNTGLQNMLQSHTNKNSILLSQIQMWRLVEQKWRPRHKSMKQYPLNFNKGAKNIWWIKYILFNKRSQENWVTACKKLKFDQCLSFYSSINSKWIKGMNVRPELLKIE